MYWLRAIWLDHMTRIITEEERHKMAIAAARFELASTGSEPAILDH